MIYIENTVEKVIVLKGHNRSDIRLFPGFNEIDAKNVKELNPYFKSQAAQSLLNGYEKQVIDLEKKRLEGGGESNRIEDLKRVSRTVKVKPSLRFATEELDEDEKKDAVNAREKNDMLNKSGLTIKKQARQIVEKDKNLEGQAKELSELQATVALMAEKLKEAGIELK